MVDADGREGGTGSIVKTSESSTEHRDLPLYTVLKEPSA